MLGLKADEEKSRILRCRFDRLGNNFVEHRDDVQRLMRLRVDRRIARRSGEFDLFKRLTSNELALNLIIHCCQLCVASSV